MSFGNGLFGPLNDNTSIKEKKYEKEFYSCSFKTDLGEYELNISLKHDKLILNCGSEIEFLSLYTYSKELTLEELKNLSNNFKSCNNIEQIFTSFINILNGITIKINKTNYESKLYINFSDEDSLTMTIKIPLIYQTFENIEIIFEKQQKSIVEQYSTLRTKYLKVKDLILNHNCDDKNRFLFGYKSLKDSLKDIEKTE